MLENSVFLHLRQTGKEIWYHKGNRECDFICRAPDNKYSASQVCWQLTPQNEKREIEGLIEAMNSVNLDEGSILTFDQEDSLTVQGKSVRLIPVWKWMTARE